MSRSITYLHAWPALYRLQDIVCIIERYKYSSL